MGRGQGYLFGVAPAGEQAENAVPRFKVLDLVTDGADRPGHLQTHIGRGAGRRRIVAGALEQVGAVDGGGVDIDEDLVRGTGWVGHILPMEGAVAVVCYGYSFHGVYFALFHSGAQGVWRLIWAVVLCQRRIEVLPLDEEGVEGRLPMVDFTRARE